MRPMVDLHASGFAGDYASLNMSQVQAVPCSQLDLVRCLITASSQRPFSKGSIRDLGLVRSMAFGILEPLISLAARCVSEGGSLRIHDSYWGLTPTDKRLVSQRLAEAFAKFHSQQLLQIPRLFVVEAARASRSLTVAYVDPGKGKPKEPDLVGQSLSQDWHVIEAKGSSRSSSYTAVYNKGKLQASNIATIDGVAPSTRSVCMTFLDQPRLFTAVRDPEDRGRLDLRLDRARFDAFYFRGFQELIERQSTGYRRQIIDGYGVIFGRGPGAYEIGLEERVFESLQNPGPVPSQVFEGLAEVSARQSDLVSIGLDGVVVRLRANG